VNIWITGAGSGIGRELALAYSAAGHSVTISGRSADKLAEVVATAQTRQHRGPVQALVFDVSDAQSVAIATTGLTSLHSHLDLVILNAGTCEYVNNQDLDPSLFRRVFDTNVFGLINSVNAALPLLRAAPRKPLLAGVCSLASFIGFPRAEAYGASKAAARYFLHSLRTDFRDLFDVTVINPGFVVTPMTAANDFPMPFVMNADAAAKRIVRALESRPLEHNFPRRLVLVLRLAQAMQRIWYRIMGKKRHA
jgi:NAD(P)-dependent dehydrogenase (short-subunit alcohol dehydrogenase family)